MPSALSKLGRFLGLTDEEDFYEEDQLPAVRREEPANLRAEAKVVPLADRWAAHEAAAAAPSVVADLPADSQPSKIITIAPRSFNDAKDIGEEIRRGHSVIMNLQDCDEALARRLVDYASGLTHGIEGKIDRISRGVFVISPKSVDVTELVRQSVTPPTGFYNQS